MQMIVARRLSGTADYAAGKARELFATLVI
jgi:hypothetical protein